MTKKKKTNPRGPALPVIYVSQEQRDAVREGLPEPYSASARALLLALAGRMDLVPETLQAWAEQWLRETAEELGE